MRLERFLDRQVETARGLDAPAVVGGEVRARSLVQQHAQADAAAGRERIAEVKILLRVADGRRVEKRDHAEQTVARDRSAIFHLTVQEALAAEPPFAVAPARAAVGANRRQ